MTAVDLTQTHNGIYRPGRSFFVRAIWLIVEGLLFSNPVVTGYALKRQLLRWFGAQIGRNVLIKPGVHVKYPWRLSIGDHSWIGERSWIDNMENVSIGAHAVVSQGAYLCTGNHDWSDPGMPLTPRPIRIDDGAWVGAFARVAPGTSIGREAVLVLGAVLLDDAEPGWIYAGNPATPVRQRTIDRVGASIGVG